jgi:carbon storage regulator
MPFRKWTDRLGRRNVGAPCAEERSMLVLSRKKDECIVINNDITIVVVEIRGDKVRLGVEAPKEVPVHRREVYEAIARGDDVEPRGDDRPQGSAPPPAAPATPENAGGPAEG